MNHQQFLHDLLNSISRVRTGDDELITLGGDGSITIKDYYLGSKMQILLA